MKQIQLRYAGGAAEEKQQLPSIYARTCRSPPIYHVLVLTSGQLSENVLECAIAYLRGLHVHVSCSENVRSVVCQNRESALSSQSVTERLSLRLPEEHATRVFDCKSMCVCARKRVCLRDCACVLESARADCACAVTRPCVRVCLRWHGCVYLHYHVHSDLTDQCRARSERVC